MKLLSYATVVSGGETPASVSVEASGTQAELGVDHIVVMFRDTQYDCVPWGKLYNLPQVDLRAQRHHRPVRLRSRSGDRRVGVEGRGHGVLHVRPALSG